MKSVISTDDASSRRSMLYKLSQYLSSILSSPDSRNIFWYLCLNLVFTGVELLYGMWTNSLGLISDGFHMLFDCSALLLGLWASIASKWSPSRSFTFGYGRIEVLSGFANGLFLIVISFAVFSTAVQRIYDPPKVATEKLLVVSVAGLAVNILGITVFRHAHTHGGKSCDHGHKQTHSHSHDHHGHTHHEHNNNKGGTTNMRGVFLHILADTLGSIGVIVSTLLIESYNWYIADPICSLFISLLIFLSVLPLLQESSLILLQRLPEKIETNLFDAMNKLKSIDGVLSYRELHTWSHVTSMLTGSLIVQVKNDVSEHKVRQQVATILRDIGLSKLTIQVEKLTFHEHMAKITTGYYNRTMFPDRSLYHLQSTNDISIRVKDI